MHLNDLQPRQLHSFKLFSNTTSPICLVYHMSIALEHDVYFFVQSAHVWRMMDSSVAGAQWTIMTVATNVPRINSRKLS